MEEPFASWSEFNVAVAGAGAALGGLLIVALSVNIATIAKSPGLAARAGASIAALILGVALSCAALIPGQQPLGFGAQVLVGAALCAIIDVRSGMTVARDAARTVSFSSRWGRSSPWWRPSRSRGSRSSRCRPAVRVPEPGGHQPFP